MALSFIRRLWRWVADANAQGHVLDLIASCSDRNPEEEPAWVKLFERHPEDEVVAFDSTSDICSMLHTLRVARMTASRRRPLMYFTSFPGSGKSRLCGKLAEFVHLLRLDDAAALGALRRADPVSYPAAAEWAHQLHVVGLNFNSSRWSLGPLDRSLAEHGLLVPLYLRIFFFMKADLNSADASRAWLDLCALCHSMFRSKLIDEGFLSLAVNELLRGLAGASPPYQPLVIIVDELHKVKDFFSSGHADAGDVYRATVCKLADVVEGYVLFSSLDAQLMTDETSSSGRPVKDLGCFSLVPTRLILEAALVFNVQRGVHLNINGVLARWSLQSASPGGHPYLARAVSALACLVGDDVRFATFLARQLMRAAVDAGTVYNLIKRAAEDTAFTHGKLWHQPYGPTVFAHVVLGTPVPADQHLTDQNRALLPDVWDVARLRGHVQAVGGMTLRPKLPLYALWGFVANKRAINEHGIFKGIRELLKWSGTSLSWCGFECFFQACVMILDNSRALAWSEVDEPLVALYPSFSHAGGDSVLVDPIIDAIQPRSRVRTVTLAALIKEHFVHGDGSMYNCVWKLNQGASAMDAAVFYTTSDGLPLLLCIQIKFSGEDSSSTLSWKDSCDWVSAMRAACAREAGTSWADLEGRVAYLIAARRMRGPNYEQDKASNPQLLMSKAIVLCWQDMQQCLGSFLYDLLQHAETLFEAEVVQA